MCAEFLKFPFLFKIFACTYLCSIQKFHARTTRQINLLQNSASPLCFLNRSSYRWLVRAFIFPKSFVIVCKNFFGVFFSRRPELFYYNPLIHQKIFRKSMYQRCSNSGVSHRIKCNKETLESFFSFLNFFEKNQ